MRKRILVVVIFAFVCCLVLLFYWRATKRPALIQTPRVYEPSTVLSPQDTLMLLEHFNTAITKREAELKSGIIEFSLTLSKIKTLFSKNPVYEERLKWHVTYRFSGQQRFYQIQERVKVKPGWFRRAKWKESKRYKFQADDSGKKGYVNRGDGWQWTSHHPITFNSYGSPLRWKWDTNLTRMTQRFGPIVDAQNVIGEEERVDYFKFEDWRADRIETTELWSNPQKDYRTTKVVQQTRYINKELTNKTLVFSGEPVTDRWLSSHISQLRYTCQLAQFEPSIWYPQTSTEVREVVDAENSHFLMGEKSTLQVHSAAFNIPIAVKDLLLQPDR